MAFALMLYYYIGMKSLESLKRSPKTEGSGGKGKETAREGITEREAEARLDALLEDPDNAFLLENPQNREKVEKTASSVEALQFAEDQIARRVERAMDIRVVSEIEGIEIHDVSYKGIKDNIDTILRNADEIGRGGDGFVVIDKTEIRNLPPEICYKFAIQETTPRGRNTTAGEFQLQELFYQSLEDIPESKIGVPMPFYSVEIGDTKMIAMEKLNARSVEDLERGKGHIPDWFDVDEFCDELKKVLAHFHKHGLFHRDMHIGNVMISQESSEGEKIGFIVDFGLSGRGKEGMDPYVKEVAGETFTYDDDYDIVASARGRLNALKKRS